MRGITDQTPLVDGLRDLLAATPGSVVVRARIARVLDVVAVLT